MVRGIGWGRQRSLNERKGICGRPCKKLGLVGSVWGVEEEAHCWRVRAAESGTDVDRGRGA